MASTPNFAATARIGSGVLTTADTSLTAPTTVQTILTAASGGTRIEMIEVMGVATTVAGLVNLFLHDGSTYSLWQQIPISAVTTSTTNPSFVANLSSASDILILPLVLPSGWSLRATTTVAQTGIRVIAVGGDF